MKPELHKNFETLHELTQSLHHEEGKAFTELSQIAEKLDLVDMNRVLFTCDQEERDLGYGGAAYDIPDFGAIVYCGLQGFVSLLTDISPHNDLGHPLCNNLRNGDWMMGKFVVNKQDLNTTNFISNFRLYCWSFGAL